MTKSDDAILEFLDEHALAFPPRAIEYNLRTRKDVEISYTTVNRRLKELLENGLVHKEYEEGGFYSITDRGRKYLAGELSKDDLEE